jgi:hypothetical protein
MKIVTFVVKNQLGEFESSPNVVNQEQLDNIINLSKTFYAGDAGFEFWADYGFVVIPPEITRQSVLMIKIEDQIDQK